VHGNYTLQGCPHLSRPVLTMLLFQSLLFIPIASQLSGAQCTQVLLLGSFVQSTSQIPLHTTPINFHLQQSKVRRGVINVEPVATKPLNAKTSMLTLCKTSLTLAPTSLNLYSPPDPNSVVGNVEEIVVAYCTLPGRGTRLLPAGTTLQAHLFV